MRKHVIAGNWKMNKTRDEAVAFIEKAVEKVEASEQVEAVVCAPFPYLSELVEKAKDSHVKIGAQNMHYEKDGAYTGEVSPEMLVDIGVTYVIIGHSERREYFVETDESVNKKAKAALSIILTPMFWIVELLNQGEAEGSKPNVKIKVKPPLTAVPKKNDKKP